MNPIRLPVLTALAAGVLLAACGGGSRSDAPAEVTLTGRAVDGPLQGATACYDLNDDLACGTDEPRSAPTTADGRFTLRVAASAAGRHAVVVEVPATAIDADTGAAVGRAFVLRAPATGQTGGHEVFASPLSTLVLAHMRASGLGRDEAAAQVQQRARLAVSPLADFTGSAPGMAEAARLARLAQLTALAQGRALDALLGSTDREGKAITTAVVEREVHGTLLGALGALADAAGDFLIAQGSPAERESALQAAAAALAVALGPDAEAVRTAGTLQRLAEPPAADPPVPTGVLTSFQYTDRNNWLLRTLQSSAADNVLDASNQRRLYDWRIRSTGNTATGTAVMTADVVNPGSTATVHWNGSAWVTRAAGQRFESRAHDAQGRNDYNFFGLEAGVGIRRVLDISNEDMEFVVRDRIRSFAGSANGVAYANWGPSNLSLYTGAAFPPGSYLIYQTNTITSTAVQYSPDASNEVRAYSAAIAAGGDARSNPSLACNSPAATLNAAFQPVATLEVMISRFRGTPCVLNASGTSPDVSLNPDEWWAAAAVNLGNLANINTLPVGTGNFYTTTASIRVSFAASGNRVTFWRCLRRTADGSARNCSTLGIGTWSIQTLGDARVLSFSTAPALAQRLGSANVFVERGGKIYFGSKSPVGVTSTDLRLNLTAANAVMLQLGLPRIRPVTQPGTATGASAAALATLQGAWGGDDATNSTAFRFGPNGRYWLAETRAPDGFLNTQTGAELGWMEQDAATGQLASQIQVDSNLTAGLSHPQPTDPGVVITATAIRADDNSFVINRLPNDDASLVGLWALDSPTDLAVPHLVLFASGRGMFVMHAAAANADCLNGTAAGQCPPGVERLTYTFDAATGSFVADLSVYDTNGCQGLFVTCPAAVAQGAATSRYTRTFTVAADRQSITFLDGSTPRTLYRIRPQ